MDLSLYLKNQGWQITTPAINKPDLSKTMTLPSIS